MRGCFQQQRQTNEFNEQNGGQHEEEEGTIQHYWNPTRTQTANEL